MRSTLLLALVALAAAAPKPVPQDLPIDDLESLPDPTGILGPNPTATAEVVVVATAAAVSAVSAAIKADPSAAIVDVPNMKAKRGSCAAQPDGYGPVPYYNPTVADFESFSVYAASANNAPSTYTSPMGSTYSKVFSNLQASMGDLGSYLGFKEDAQSYDLSYCSTQCDQWYPGCVAFNIYFERDPTQDPDPNSCPNPPAFVNIKCAFYGMPIASSAATQTGQPRAQFTVAVAGADGYVKQAVAPVIPGFSNPVPFGNAAINAPPQTTTYIGVKTIPSKIYDPNLCSAACLSTTASNKKSAQKAGASSYRACNFFNAYLLLKDGVGTAVTCSLYTVTYGTAQATNFGQTRASGVYTIADSYGYSLNPQDPGTL